jgi:hypothetical protein
MKDETIQGMAMLACITFNIKPEEKILFWAAEGCEKSDPKPDELFALRNSKNTYDQMRWMLFLYQVEKYIGLKNAKHNKNVSAEVYHMIEREYEYRIFSIKQRLNAHSSLK